METNVLILDDQLEMVDPIRRLAHLYGWRTHFVGSLQELELAMHGTERPELVLVNRRPGVASWELEHWLLRLKIDVPVVVLSEPGNENGQSVPGVVWMGRPNNAADTEHRLVQVLGRLGLGSLLTSPHGIVGQSQQHQEVLARGDDSDLSLGADSQKERSGAGRDLPAGLTLRELEQLYILQTLARMGQNRTRTAAALGISLRGLQYKLKSYRQDSLNLLTPFERAS
jgi:DNA-binding NtrC family response regulator